MYRLTITDGPHKGREYLCYDARTVTAVLDFLESEALTGR